MPYEKRNGLRTIRDFAYHVCRYVSFWTPIIRIAFPGNLALHAALVAANNACALLVEEADAVIAPET